MSYFTNNGAKSDGNSSTSPLAASGTFTGTGELNGFPDVFVVCETDQSGTLYFDFSQNNTNWTTYPTAGFVLASGINEVHSAIKAPRYFRTRLINGSNTAQQYLRLSTYYGSFGKLSAPVGSSINRDTDSTVVKAVSTAEQPDGDFVTAKSDGSAFATSSTLGIYGEYDSPWIDTDGWKEIELAITSDVPSSGNGIYIEFTDDVQAETPLVKASQFFDYNNLDVDNGTSVIRTATALDGFRVRYINGNQSQSSFFLESSLRTTPAGTTRQSLESNIDPATVAEIGRSVIVGRRPDGVYRNVQVTDTNALLVSDFRTEVVRGNVSGYTSYSKFGRNGTIDTGTTPEDVWGNGGLYTGQPSHASGAQTIQIVSSADSDASGSVGAWGVFIEGLNNQWQLDSEVLPLNGTSGTTSNKQWHRVFRSHIIGENDNDGTVTIRHSSTPANVFATIEAGLNQTAVAAFTVPSGFKGYMSGLRISMARSANGTGSANVSLRSRDIGGVYRTREYYTITNSVPAQPALDVPLSFEEMTDIIIRVENVSTSTTSVSANFDIILINNDI